MIDGWAESRSVGEVLADHRDGENLTLHEGNGGEGGQRDAGGHEVAFHGVTPGQSRGDGMELPRTSLCHAGTFEMIQAATTVAARTVRVSRATAGNEGKTLGELTGATLRTCQAWGQGWRRLWTRP